MICPMITVTFRGPEDYRSRLRRFLALAIEKSRSN
jgi:hypothetical protein